MEKVFKIKELEQIRLLSDPLKLQLLQAFAEGEKTTKQVATELGESVTKLYRHVDALRNAGLLVITNEKQKRGTVERTFRAVAFRFEADHRLFAEQDDNQGMIVARDILRVCEGEILAAMADEARRDEPEAIFMRLRCRASPERVAALHKSLKEWVESAQSDEDIKGENAEEIGALIALYPIK